MGAPSKLRLGGLVNSQGPKQAVRIPFNVRNCPQRLNSLLKKLSGSPCSIILVIPTPNAAEESEIPKSSGTRRVWTTDAAVNEQDSSAVGVGMTKTGCAGL